MNAMTFLVIKLEAEQRFRKIMDQMMQNMEMGNGNNQTLPPDNSGRQPDYAPQPDSVPGGGMGPQQSTSVL